MEKTLKRLQPTMMKALRRGTAKRRRIIVGQGLRASLAAGSGRKVTWVAGKHDVLQYDAVLRGLRLL